MRNEAKAPVVLKSIGVGTQIICEFCRVLIAEVVRPIIEGQPLSTKMFKFSELQQRRPGERAQLICKKCGTRYGRGGKIHTLNGWRP